MWPSIARASNSSPPSFGIGAALTLDEFALWLNLQDVYWKREGRLSVDAVIITVTLLAIFVIGGQFFVEVAREILGRPHVK